MLRKWIDEGKRYVPLSVNLSRIDLYEPRLCDILTELMKKYNLPKGLLKLEITETAYMESPNTLIDVAHKLREAGFLLEMDDFGSGYSSLNTLKDMPVDIIKLDLKFLENRNNSERGALILNSVVRMAEWLKLPMIAEGVETTRQAEYLKSIGCRFMQGYLFSKPMSVEEFEKFIESFTLGDMLNKAHNDDLVNMTQLLDPQAQTALLFNAYVGAAVILEYSAGILEALRVNDRYYKEIGISYEQFRDFRVDFLRRFIPESREKLKAVLNKAVVSAEEQDCELISYDPNDHNKILYTRNRIRMIAHTQGRSVFFCIIENTTEKKELEAVSKKQREFLNNTYQTFPYGIVHYTMPDEKNGNIKVINVNNTAVEMLGFESEDQYKIHFDEMFNKQANKETEQALYAIKEAIRTGKRIEQTNRVTRADGKALWIISLVEVIKDIDGNDILQYCIRDITNQYYRQEEYNALMDSVPGGLGLYKWIDGFTQCIYFNDGLAQMLGYTREEYQIVCDNDCAGPILSEDRKKLHVVLAEGIEKRKNIDFTYRLYKKNGDIVWFRICSSVFIRDDNIPMFYAMFTDVTQQENIMSRLKETSALLSACMDNIYGGIIVMSMTHNSDIKHIFANERYYSIFGYDKSDISPDMNLMEHNTHPDDIEFVRKKVNDIVKSGIPDSFECRCMKKDGSVIFVRINASVIKLESEQDRSVVISVLSDITQEKRASDRLKESNERMQTIMDNVNCSVCAFEVENNVSRLVFANDNYFTMLGYTRSEMKAENINTFDLIYEKDRDELMRLSSKACISSQSFEYEYRCHRKDGNIIWLHCNASIVKDANYSHPILLCVIYDISAARKKERVYMDVLEKQRMQSMLDIAISDVFEYICLINTDEGTYKTYANEFLNTHNIPKEGNFDDIARYIRDIHVVENEREEYYKNAVLENVILQMKQTGGNYSYSYNIDIGRYEAKFYYSDAFENELLMTVKRLF